jgi:DNA-binding transcriptional MerR regulator
MTVRNIRNHQSRGLLPPPRLEARTGYYGEEHLERLRIIQAMQADGFNLEAIRRLLSGSPGSAERVLDLRRAVTAPAESPTLVTRAELEERLGPLDAATLAEAERLGVVVPRGDGELEVPSPALLRAAEDATRGGVRLVAALGVLEDVRRGCDRMAEAFVGVFMEELWGPRGAMPRPSPPSRACGPWRPDRAGRLRAGDGGGSRAGFARELGR